MPYAKILNPNLVRVGYYTGSSDVEPLIYGICSIKSSVPHIVLSLGGKDIYLYKESWPLVKDSIDKLFKEMEE